MAGVAKIICLSGNQCFSDTNYKFFSSFTGGSIEHVKFMILFEL